MVENRFILKCNAQYYYMQSNILKTSNIEHPNLFQFTCFSSALQHCIVLFFTLCALFFTMRLITIGTSPYHTLAVYWSAIYGSYVMCDLIVWENTTLFIIPVIWENAVGLNVKWINCSPKGSQLSNWTSAVFSHIVLNWEPLAYQHVDILFMLLVVAWAVTWNLKLLGSNPGHAAVCHLSYSSNFLISNNLVYSVPK